MAGNVWQWTASDYDRSAKELRGGSWYFTPRLVRASYRSFLLPFLWFDFVGVRCVR